MLSSARSIPRARHFLWRSTWLRFASSVSHLPDRSPPFHFELQGQTVTVMLAPKTIPLGSFPAHERDKIAPAFTKVPPEPEDDAPQLLKSPDRFNANPEFWQAAGKIVKQNIHRCSFFNSIAQAEGNTPYLHVYDLRAPPVPGRIPEVEDILGTVQIDSNGIVPQSMEINSMYRPVSSKGAIMVSDVILEALKKGLVEH